MPQRTDKDKPKKSCLEVGVVLLPAGGAFLGDAAIEACKRVQRMRKQRRMVLLFNEHPVEVTKADTAEDVYRRWNETRPVTARGGL